jgi:hypothetical protein
VGGGRKAGATHASAASRASHLSIKQKDQPSIEVPPGTPERYHFALTKGRGHPVCEAYLQRLNQTDFYDKPYCGRPESGSVPGFDVLRRRWLDREQFKALQIDVIEVLTNSQHNSSYRRQANPDGTVSLIEPPNMGPPENFLPGAWFYDPPVDIDNDGHPDNIVLWTGYDRENSMCGAGNARNDLPIPGDTSLVALSSDGRTVDRERTNVLTGYGGSALAPPESSVIFSSALGVFRYRGLIYYDAFFDSAERPEITLESAPESSKITQAIVPHRSGDHLIKRVKHDYPLGVFIFQNERRREVCEYNVGDMD